MTDLPCPSCPSSDAYGIDANGFGHCFSCGINVHPSRALDHLNGEISGAERKVMENVENMTPITKVFRPWKERGFTKETIERYKVDVGGPEADYEAKYPLVTVDDVHVANKVRLPAKIVEKPDGTKKRRKSFPQEGDPKNPKIGLWGRHAFPAGSAKTITVTEGQDDAMAVHQMTGNRWPAVSVHSAQSAASDMKTDFEYLNSFENIVINFDNDEAGLKASKQAVEIGFPPGKIRVLTLRKHKDANDYLLKGDREAYDKEWWQAPVYRPDGLRMGGDLWEDIITRNESFATKYPWRGLNAKTYGIRLSELVTVTADTGVGKTSVLKHIEYLLLTDEHIVEKGYGVGFLHLEEPNGDTALGLLSIHNGVPYHLPDVERPVEDLRSAYETVLNNDRVVIWDHFGSNSVDAVLDKVRHMVALGCRYIVLDHLSILVSDQSGDERKQLDEITTKLKTLCMELDIAVIAVIHTNRQGQIRGTAGVEQLSNIVIRLEREKMDPDEWRRNVTKISVEKNRFCGFTGPACHLWYNKDTARLVELEPEEALTYENGGTIHDGDENWARG